MPRASWSGFLRLSLVSCPVYLSPATTRTKSLRLHQVWRPAAADEPGPEEPDRDRDGQVGAGSRPQPADPRETEQADHATRIALRPHDPRTGEEIEKSEVVKGYEYGRGQFVTFSAVKLTPGMPQLRCRSIFRACSFRLPPRPATGDGPPECWRADALRIAGLMRSPARRCDRPGRVFL